MVSILTLDGDESITPSHPGDDLSVGGSPTLLGSTTVNKPTGPIYYRIELRQTASGG
ncbi:MAG: hypothetical protein QXX84_06130 [Sulfolobales archaeon]